MPMKQTGRKIYRTANGKQVDMDLLRQRNELTPAVGNARVNARGDELGPGGKIIKKREDVMKEYYKNNPKASIPDQEPVRQQEVQPEAAPEMNKKSSSKKTTRAQQKTEQIVNDPTPAELAEFDDDWVEDSDGNFVPKGE
jgi:long-subunit acyl-CoA synthetase (AMP-forming)